MVARKLPCRAPARASACRLRFGQRGRGARLDVLRSSIFLRERTVAHHTRRTRAARTSGWDFPVTLNGSVRPRHQAAVVQQVVAEAARVKIITEASTWRRMAGAAGELILEVNTRLRGNTRSPRRIGSFNSAVAQYDPALHSQALGVHHEDAVRQPFPRRTACRRRRLSASSLGLRSVGGMRRWTGDIGASTCRKSPPVSLPRPSCSTRPRGVPNPPQVTTSPPPGQFADKSGAAPVGSTAMPDVGKVIVCLVERQLDDVAGL